MGVSDAASDAAAGMVWTSRAKSVAWSKVAEGVYSVWDWTRSARPQFGVCPWMRETRKALAMVTRAAIFRLGGLGAVLAKCAEINHGLNVRPGAGQGGSLVYVAADHGLGLLLHRGRAKLVQEWVERGST